jgi:hypothetical protein
MWLGDAKAKAKGWPEVKAERVDQEAMAQVRSSSGKRMCRRQDREVQV